MSYKSHFLVYCIMIVCTVLVADPRGERQGQGRNSASVPPGGGPSSAVPSYGGRSSGQAQGMPSPGRSENGRSGSSRPPIYTGMSDRNSPPRQPGSSTGSSAPQIGESRSQFESRSRGHSSSAPETSTLPYSANTPYSSRSAPSRTLRGESALPGRSSAPSVRRAESSPGQDKLYSRVPGSAPSVSVDEAQVDFRSASGRLEQALTNRDYNSIRSETEAVRTKATGLQDRLGPLPLEQRLKAGLIEKMYQDGAATVEEGRSSRDDSKIRIGYQKIGEANERLQNLEKKR